MLAWFGDRPDLLKNILWNDEAVFHLGGFVIGHNCHYWVGKDLCVTSKKMQNRLKITVSCGMTSDRIVGPFILHDTMNAKRYLTMLRDEVKPIISAWDNNEDLIFMQDGAPQHFAIVDHEWLNVQFSKKWMGRRGSHKWPARCFKS